MASPKELTIEFGEEGLLHLKGSEGYIEITRGSLVDALANFADINELLADVQELQLAKKTEQYEKLKPIGFDYAHESVKKKREEAKSTDNVEKIQWIHDNISYNSDGTMNIIKLNKTFCENVSGIGKRCNWEDAKQLAISKGYTLPTDYNDCDTDEVKQQSDWYKVINVFSNGKGDTVEGMELFRDMAGCNNRYRAATECEDEKGMKIDDWVRGRGLGNDLCFRDWANTNSNKRVCGFKDSV